MAIVSSKINRDITVGDSCNIFTLLFCDGITKEDYVGIETTKPDIHLLNHEQWDSTLDLLNRDIKFIESHLEENKINETEWKQIKPQLPSQNMIYAGVLLKYSKRPSTGMNENGIFEHSEKICFKDV